MSNTQQPDGERDPRPTDPGSPPPVVQFTVTERLVIGDPVRIAVDSRRTLHDAIADRAVLAVDGCAGTWRAQLTVDPDGLIAAVILTRDGASLPAGARLRPHAQFSIDSGQAYAGCHTRLPLDYPELLEVWEQDPLVQYRPHPGGLVTNTGYGDGIYTLHLAYQPTTHQPAVLAVRFIDPPASPPRLARGTGHRRRGGH
jgi:hypothetical protein